MYIVDTNVFLEGLLDRKKAPSVRKFLRKTPIDTLCITDFSLHTLGVILFRLKKYDIFISFVKDMIIDGMQIVSLQGHDLKELETVAIRYNLDFDDAYLYVSAEKNGFELISFDKDFDTTALKRKEPSEVTI